MPEYKYASWVKGEYLTWAKRKQCDIDEPYIAKHYPELSFEKHPIYTFLSRPLSEKKLSTLKTIASLYDTAKLSELDIAFHLITYIDEPMLKSHGAHKEKTKRAIEQFKKATNRLFDSIQGIYGDHPIDLILSSNPKVDKSTIQKFNDLNLFRFKTTRDVLLDFADHVESLGTGNPYYLVGHKAPTESQYKIRSVTYNIIEMIGPKATRELEDLGSLIAHIVMTTLDSNHDLNSQDVSKQATTAIDIYESRLQE